jgi:hypothetical protein
MINKTRVFFSSTGILPEARWMKRFCAITHATILKSQRRVEPKGISPTDGSGNGRMAFP